jgi:hypothetical protein
MDLWGVGHCDAVNLVAWYHFGDDARRATSPGKSTRPVPQSVGITATGPGTSPRCRCPMWPARSTSSATHSRWRRSRRAHPAPNASQTLVGRIANRPKGFPVVGGDPPATPKSRALQMTAGIADDRFGTQRPLLLEVLLDPAGLVVAADLRIDPFGDDLGAPAARGLSGDAPVEDQRHRLGSAHVEVIAESCSKNERPAAGRSNTRVSETSNLRNAGS